MRRHLGPLVLAAGGHAAACGHAAAPTAPAGRAGLCDGLSAAACDDRTLVHALCLIEPEHASCGPLRAAGTLPPAPPPLASLAGCWQAVAPGDAAATWFCLGPAAIDVRVAGRWDRWPHGGWRRDDTPAVARWRADAADGRTLWLTVVTAAPPRLYLADGTGFLATGLADGDAATRATLDEERAALPAPAAVCAAARACAAAVPRPALAGDAEGEVAGDDTAGAATLGQCVTAWTRAADRLTMAMTAAGPTAGVPAACGTWRADGWARTIDAPPQLRAVIEPLSSAP